MVFSNIIDVQESVTTYMLILCLTNLLSFITSSNNFSFDSLGFSR